MHNKMIGNWSVNFNSDFSGDVYLEAPDVPGVTKVPFYVLEHLVAMKVRSERISALEDSGPDELFGLKHKGPVYD